MVEVRRRRPRRAVRRVWDGYDTQTRQWLGWEYRTYLPAFRQASTRNQLEAFLAWSREDRLVGSGRTR